jgi:hypothetical protein
MKRLALYFSGPLLVALLAPLALGAGPLYPYVLTGAIPLVLIFTLFIAAPLFMVVARKFGVRAPLFIGLAFCAGFLSYLMFSLLSSPTNASVGGVAFAIEGDLTAAGWISVLCQSLAIGIVSIPSGILWWLGARIPLDRTPHGA